MNLPTNPARERRELSEPAARPVARPREQALPHRTELSFARRATSGFFQLLVVVGILAAGYVAYGTILDSAPRAERKRPERVARLVEVETVRAAETGPVIEAWGDVTAAQTLIVRPEVSGTVVWADPELVAGGRLTAGQEVVRIDDADLRLAVAQAEGAIAQIDARILIEQGQGEIGKRELTRLTRNLTDEQRALVTRAPQMAQLRAERAAAVAIRDQARNALDRAVVRAPFNAVVVSEEVAPGSVLSAGAVAATLVASDRFDVKLAVPAGALQWMRFDGTQVVSLTQPGVWPEGAERTGRLVRLNSALTATGRMAEVIVEIPDPLALDPANEGKPKLLLGSYVRGRITGSPVEGAIMLDRASVRDGDTVWVMNAEDKLEIRDLRIAWRGPDHVLVTGGLAEGDRVVTTVLATFAPGMELRTRTEESGS